MLPEAVPPGHPGRGAVGNLNGSPQWIVDHQAGDFHEVCIVGPKLGRSAIEGAKGDLEIEDPRAFDGKIGGCLQQSRCKGGAGTEDDDPCLFKRRKKCGGILR